MCDGPSNLIKNIVKKEKVSVPKVDTSSIPTCIEVWLFKKTYMNALANPNEERESRLCDFWNDNKYFMNSCSGAHRFFLLDGCLSYMYISYLNMYLYARNHLRSQTTPTLHTLIVNHTLLNYWTQLILIKWLDLDIT